VKLQVRDYEILTWLVQMKFMLLDQITSVFFKGCNSHRAPYRRMLKLMKAGLIETKRVYTESRDLYLPTKKAAKLLMRRGGSYALGLSKDKDFANYEHDKTLIDLRILFRDLGIKTWIPERILRSARPAGSCPDALLVTSNYLYAVEYERTEKKLTRYKEIVERYNRGNYHAVLFICRDQLLVKKIKSIASSRRFYFITLEDLMRNRENAVFISWSNSLPVHYLIETSSERDLSDLPREVLQYLVSPKKDQRVEASTPWISIPKTLEKSHNEYEFHDAEEDAYWENVK